MVKLPEKEQYKQEFIQRVRDVRAAEHKTQEEMAVALGVKQDEYKHWEASRVIPHHLIERYCAVFSLDPAWIITGRGRMKRPSSEPARPVGEPAGVPAPKTGRRRRIA